MERKLDDARQERAAKQALKAAQAAEPWSPPLVLEEYNDEEQDFMRHQAPSHLQALVPGFAAQSASHIPSWPGGISPGGIHIVHYGDVERFGVRTGTGSASQAKKAG